MNQGLKLGLAVTASLAIGGVVTFGVLHNIGMIGDKANNTALTPIDTVQTVTTAPVQTEKTVSTDIVTDTETVEAVVPAQKEQIVLKFSHVVGDDTPKGKAALFFERKLEEITNGKIDVQVYPNSELYNDKSVLKALKFNNVQMAAPSFSKFSKSTPQLALFDLPFLFRDLNHVHKVQDTKVGIKLKRMASKKGIVALSYWDNHFKQMTSSKTPLLTPEQAKGQKFRIMSSKVLEEQIKSFDGIPRKMAFKEVRGALEKGIIDAQENTISNIYSKDFYKHQKYLALTNHGYLGYLVVVSEKFWNSLTPELQEKLEQALTEATEAERKYAQELNDSQLNEIKKYAKDTGSIEVNPISKEQRVKWMKKVRYVYPKFYDEGKIGKALIKETMQTR